VALEGRCFHADATLVAVDMRRCSADAADTALVAVELPLVLVVQEHTNGTPIVPQNYSAALADLAGLLFERT